MERLTYRSPEFKNPVSYGACESIKCDCVCDKCKIQEIVAKLCAYEDTGLTPEEVSALDYKLMGVMHSVDKWLEGDELKQDEVNRAAIMREKTLKLVEGLEHGI